MKKVLWIATVLLMLSLCIAGCGDETGPDVTEPSGETAGSTQQTSTTADTQDTTEGDTTQAEDSQTEAVVQPTSGDGQPQEQETTAQQVKPTETLPVIELPDDVFTEPEENTTQGNPDTPTKPAEPTVEATTKPTQPTEPEQRPTETTPAATVPTEATEEETTFWGDDFDQGIELPIDEWD